jgi:hypothetical protein
MSTTVHRNDGPFSWHLVCPCSEPDTSLLEQISEFRGRTLYAEGRRPRFARDGGYADDDPIDPHSFHVTVRAAGDLIGCGRVGPVRELSQSFLGRLVGVPAVQEALRIMNVKASECAEAGRWIVAPSARGSSLGPNLLASMWVVGRWLGKRYMFGAVGVRDGQVTMLGRWGGQTAPAITPLFVEEYDDEVSVMYFDLQHPPVGVAARLDPVERLLGLCGIENGGLPAHLARTPLGSGSGVCSMGT